MPLEALVDVSLVRAAFEPGDVLVELGVGDGQRRPLVVVIVHGSNYQNKLISSNLSCRK